VPAQPLGLTCQTAPASELPRVDQLQPARDGDRRRLDHWLTGAVARPRRWAARAAARPPRDVRTCVRLWRATDRPTRACCGPPHRQPGHHPRHEAGARPL